MKISAAPVAWSPDDETDGGAGVTRPFLAQRPFEGDLPTGRRAPQYQLAIMLGDYWFLRTEHLPSAALVDMLAEFGVTEPSARQAMRRLASSGLLVASKSSRTTAYGFPERSADAAAARVRLLVDFGRTYPEWDGEWTVALFSVPEAIRDVRRSLRTRLHGLRFGMLQDATWVSPHDRTAEASALFDEYEITDAHVFRAHHVPRVGAESDLRGAFDLEALMDDYRHFTAHYGAFLDDPAAVAQPLVTRTLLMNDWQFMRRSDPDLPRELVPDDWPRDEARHVFSSLYRALGPAAEQRFRDILGVHAPDLAPLAVHHVPLDEPAT